MKGDILHILNRGVEKRKIFFTEKDYWRFMYNLCDFNDKDPVQYSYNDRRQYFPSIRKPKTKIVDIFCLCLMPNHHHILAQERIDGGASIFSKKLTSGYTQYFNLENNRGGVLFQGRSKIIPIKKDEHFIHMPYYIFSNPIKLIEPQWKERGIKDIKKVIEFLENYRWSSYLDIIGKENLPFVINKKLFFELFDTNEKQFKKDFIEWLASLAMR